ncbi:glycosyltransferase family 32 protein [Purpureocillium lilacinum]|uniref:Glycosyltransferase family 32 protein n=1 Tax=Purpureocillium lilacinum TaxID=33203 RepID=A0A179EXT8_PURLI|nr:glycosyltransferase family 32 protein [Purpureocillium lilacinum]OAQ57988.1 glycosyltransferase family 32 protein [Purpureocillium lilacinum]
MTKHPFRSQYASSARRTHLHFCLLYTSYASSARRTHLHFHWWTTLLTLLGLWWVFRDLLYTAWALAALRLSWRAGAEEFVLSKAHDDFDITFIDYDKRQLSAAPHPDIVPPVFHHIALGKHRWKNRWQETRQSCLDIHPGWEVHLWTDENAPDFVRERFPELFGIWNNYPYHIDRADALRYMVLFEFGGVAIDMDLKCKRALGPLRRFDFVAPEAQPTGFSIAFMMAARRNPFIHDILRNLMAYNRPWLGMPDPTIMLGAGCHFASFMHAAQMNRSSLKILPGPMHSLRGRATTPIFDHFGSSPRHSPEARLLVTLGYRSSLVLFVSVGVVLVLLLRRRVFLRRS